MELDDAVMCEDSGHRAMQALSVAVIVVVAVGLPSLLLYILAQRMRKYLPPGN